MTELPHVLIVDGSRVIRASLSRSLKDHFEVREETSGESAWQTLVLDSSIVAVISGLHLPKLDGFGLVEKLRTNKLRRLNSMPFYLIASDAMNEGERQQARVRGVTDFVPKGLGAAETERIIGILLERHSDPAGDDESHSASEEGSGEFRVAPQPSEETGYSGIQSDLGVSDILGQMGNLAGLSGASVDDIEVSEAHEVPAVPDVEEAPTVVEAAPTVPEIPDRQTVERVLAECLNGTGQTQAVGVLIFGLDSYDTVSTNFGRELADKIETKFARLLGKKIRTEDSLGRFGPGRIAIVAPGTNLALCAAFAERVCKGLAAAQISVRNQRIDMTVSVGVASMPEDGVILTGEDLMALAVGRLEAAVRAGGNRVLARPVATERTFDHEDFVQKLGELIGSVPPEGVSRCLGNAGLKVMPLLKQMEQSFNFGLPLEDIERKLWARARSERQVR